MRLFAFIVGLLLFTGSASGQVHLALDVAPSELPPAIPPTLRIEARNLGSKPTPLPRFAALQVSRDGKRFVAALSSRSETCALSLDDQPPLAPGERRDLTIWASVSMPWWGSDVRLYPPGKYELQLILDDALDSDQLSSSSSVLQQRGLENPVVSNVVTFTVSEPAGEDALVWNMIRGLSEPSFWSESLEDEIRAAAPDSIYAVWSVPEGEDPNESIQFAEAAIEKSRDSPAADWHRLAVAHYSVQRAYRLALEGDLAGATRADERAKTILELLERDARDPNVRKAAVQRLETDIFGEDSLRQLYEVVRGIDRPQLAAGVQCVTGDAHSRTVWFAYQYTGRDPVTIPIGPENQFVPPPADRGQPTVLEPGRHYFAFSVTFDGPQLVWHLSGEKVTAIVADIPECLPEWIEELEAGRMPIPE